MEIDFSLLHHVERIAMGFPHIEDAEETQKSLRRLQRVPDAPLWYVAYIEYLIESVSQVAAAQRAVARVSELLEELRGPLRGPTGDSADRSWNMKQMAQLAHRVVANEENYSQRFVDGVVDAVEDVVGGGVPVMTERELLDLKEFHERKHCYGRGS